VGSIEEMFKVKYKVINCFEGNMAHVAKLVLVLLVLFVSSGFASATRLENFLDLDMFTGPTGVTGQFTDQKNPNSYGFSLNVYFQDTKEVAFPSHISIGNYNFSMVSKDSSYPFPVDHSVLFSTNFMNLMVSVYNTHNWGLYLGVGYSIISLLEDKDQKNIQNYGSQQYEFQARYALSDRWGLNYRTKWQQINQYQSGTFSFIEMWSHLIGVSYLIF
jgi:hypothetical protein